MSPDTPVAQDHGPRAYRLEEVGERLGISRDQVEVLINTQQLKATNVGAGQQRPRLRVDALELQRFIDDRAVVARAPGRSKRGAA